MRSRVLAALLGLVLLAVPELLLRVVGFEREPPAPPLPKFLFAEDFLTDEENFELDRRLFWRYRPGRPVLEYLQHKAADYRTNAQGFRGPDFREARVPGTLRIAFFGDSNTFGLFLALQDTVAEQLADLVRHRGGPPVEVMNFGVLGYSSFQGLTLLRQMVPRYHPDAVVFWFGINDSQPGLVPDAQVVMPDPSLLAITRHLAHVRLWQLLRYALAPAAETERAESGHLTFRVSAQEFAANLAAARSDCEGNGAALLVPNYPALLLRKAAHLRELIALAERAGITEVMGGDELRLYRRELAIWDGASVESVGGKKILRVGPQSRPLADLTFETIDTLASHSRALTAWGRQLEGITQAIPHDLEVDLIGRLAAEDPDRCFIDLSHETRDGYHLAAEAILAMMTQKGLVPAGDGADDR